MELTVAELFAGVGGFRVGLNKINKFNNDGRAIENGEWNFVWANQYEPQYKTQDAFNCYITRFGSKDSSNLDINLVNKTEIPDHNLLVGGFPCQDYSVARSRSNEQGIQGKKGVLFWDIRDVLIEKSPSFVLLENVDRLLKSPSSQRGRDFAVMLKTFNDLDYSVFWRVINAADYSFPQKRRRVFIFAVKNNTNYLTMFRYFDDNKILNENIFSLAFPAKIKEKTKKIIDLKTYSDIVSVSDNYDGGKFLDTGFMINQRVVTSSIEVYNEKLYSLGDILIEAKKFNPKDMTKYIIDDNKLDKWKYLKGSKKIERISKTGHKYTYSEGTMYFPDNINFPARTMLTSEGSVNRSSHIIYDDNFKKYRILTEVEAELIQMFPPNWTNTMASRKRYFMMGNALVTGIVKRLEPYLRDIILQE